MAAIEDFVVKDEDFDEKWLTQQGLQTLKDVFKGTSSLLILHCFHFFSDTNCIYKNFTKCGHLDG